MFEADKQTLKDLQIFTAARGDRSVMALFGGVSSYGGRWRLESLFRKPLSDAREIQDRVDCIRHI